MAALRRRLGRLAALCGIERRGLFRHDYLRGLGFDVRTIVDVGVRFGIEELHRPFPDCFIVLVDPQRRRRRSKANARAR